MKLDLLPPVLILQIFEVCSHDYCFKVVDIVVLSLPRYFHQGHEDTLPLSLHSLEGGVTWSFGCCLCFPLTLQRKRAKEEAVEYHKLLATSLKCRKYDTSDLFMNFFLFLGYLKQQWTKGMGEWE
ncbi:hypothetical protein CsSME_00011285 [Camellia sinensis var. sinensis]